ncbi:PIN domain-containing protein [Microcella sp.]|uniref:PIN domain-containing protein n=1 Tax=Microcella sp. TaxID=1913979 RepID=UPI00256E3BCE|nr:PIN domain-containing protein [Microcella sp.]MBX9470402.1 PIN domain-containing protein [Microcella sp.]
MIVVDSSAVLAYLLDEPGAEKVRTALTEGAVMSAVNWSEVAQKVRRADAWQAARALLLSYPLQIAPVAVDDAEAAAALWMPGSPLSIADRFCLALAARLELPVLSADRAWFDRPEVIPVR